MSRILCVTRCAAPRTVTAGGEIQLRGAGLAGTTHVRFAARGGPVSVVPLSSADDSVEARVPAGARTGRVRAVNGVNQAAASPRRLRVVAPGRVPAARSLHLGASSVHPRRSFVDSGKPVRMRFRFESDRHLDLRVVLRRVHGGRVHRWVEHDASPFRWHSVVWSGRGKGSARLPEGRYELRVGKLGHHRALHAAGFPLHGHYFPVRGPHWDRGPEGQFGAPRTGGRTHEGYDIMSPCDTPIAAARGGRVIKRGYDPTLYGNYLLIKGAGEHDQYFYAHMIAPARVALGDRVRTGQRVGNVGKTGNARTVGCHLHFELHVHGTPVDPKPALMRWDRWS